MSSIRKYLRKNFRISLSHWEKSKAPFWALSLPKQFARKNQKIIKKPRRLWTVTDTGQETLDNLLLYRLTDAWFAISAKHRLMINHGY